MRAGRTCRVDVRRAPGGKTSKLRRCPVVGDVDIYEALDVYRRKDVVDYRLGSLEGCVLMLSATALILTGLTEASLVNQPAVSFLSVLFLFLVPGLLISGWFLVDYFSGAAMVPVAFAISTGIFGLLGIPMLPLQTSLGIYLTTAGAVLAAFLVAAALRYLRAEVKTYSLKGRLSWLWIPFGLLVVTLAFMSRAKLTGFYNDKWVYLAYVRELLSGDQLARYEPYFGDEAGVSRLKINGWLLEQAAMSRLTGIDPIRLVLDYLNPALVVVALLAFYALARVLFESEPAALLAGCGYAVFMLLSAAPTVLDIGGSEFITRVTEDKLTARFIFLPVGLALAVAFAKSGKLAYLATFGFLCWAVIAVHPVGFAILGLSLAGFALFHLAITWRDWVAWMRIGRLGLAGSSILIAIEALVLFTGDSLTDLLKDSDINSNQPDVLANMVFAKPELKRIYEFDDGSYIMHPWLLLEPVVLAAFILGIPFLLWRLRRSVGAQLLLGALLATAAAVYVPSIATFIGDNVVVPGQLWRLAWPISLMALLIVGWIAWEIVRLAELGLNRVGLPRRASQFVPLVIVVAGISAAAPVALAQAKEVYREDEVARSGGSCLEPAMRSIRDNVKEPSIVFAPDAINTCIPAYSSRANVVSFRGGLVAMRLPLLEERVSGSIEIPQNFVDVSRFFSGQLTAQDGVQILRSYEVDYVLVPADAPINAALENLPGVTAENIPGERCKLYAVDRRLLGG
ncbi:hypothetical protein BH23ACT11_BH23ACT11_30550 [soil metagenome]